MRQDNKTTYAAKLLHGKVIIHSFNQGIENTVTEPTVVAMALNEMKNSIPDMISPVSWQLPYEICQKIDEALAELKRKRVEEIKANWLAGINNTLENPPNYR